ncbi:uncharacterized protein LOC118450634 [Vespa mandarinia]|uniref:uncharacterized protein LOC118450634 n=1 Tax=Vespa mandarinia TaxID=7446 RepID=UPI001620EE28|nr:uncharacterized protein LOC118450634 [Vespa mandarinia]
MSFIQQHETYQSMSFYESINSEQNNSMGYQLPYSTLQVIHLKDSRIYALICVYQMIYIPCIVLGYVGFDCMFVNLSVQVIAQFSILSYKVKTLLNDSKNYHEGMKRLVLRHYRLIRWAEILEDNFNFPIMQQLLGTTIHICISGYYVLMGPETKDILTSILFVLYMFSVTSTLFIYCFIGECFIQESTNFGNAIYNYEWYNLPAIDAKFFLICMIRTKKPQFLTSGKFAILSLTVFTDEQGIANVRRSFIWNSRLLKCMGIWPLQNYVPVFLFFFTYLSLHCSLTLAELLWAPKTMDNVVANIAENIILTMTLTKITIARMNREALRELFIELEEYSLTEKYETKEEKLTFVNYTKLPPYFIIIIACSMTLAESMYYLNRVIEGIQFDIVSHTKTYSYTNTRACNNR